MNFKKWVKSIQTAGYNGAGTVLVAYLGHYLLLDPLDFKRHNSMCLCLLQSIQAPTALVNIHHNIPKASHGFVSGHGLLHCPSVFHADACLFYDSNLSLENVQEHGCLHVLLLLCICHRFFGIRVRVL